MNYSYIDKINGKVDSEKIHIKFDSFLNKLAKRKISEIISAKSATFYPDLRTDHQIELICE